MNKKDFEKQAAWVRQMLSGKKLTSAKAEEWGMGHAIRLFFSDGTDILIRPECDEGFVFELGNKFIVDLPKECHKAIVTTQGCGGGGLDDRCYIKGQCNHAWVSADNKVMTGAEICMKCHELRAAGPGKD